MELAIDEGPIHAGSIVRGRVMGTQKDRIEIGLSPVESGQTARAMEVLAIASADDGHRFEFELPATAVEFSVKNIEVTWNVKAKAPGFTLGSAERRLVIEKGDPARSVELSDTEIDRIETANSKKRRSHGNGEMVVVAMFMLTGVGIFGAGAFTAIWPPESFDGSTTPAYVMMAMSLCFFLPGYIRIRSVYRPSKVRGVTVVDHTRSAHPGDSIGITLSLEPEQSVRVGFVTTLGMFKELANANGVRTGRGGFVFSTAHESWQVADSSDPTATFTVPSDSPPTYSGQKLLVMHHLRVQPLGSTSTRWNTRRLEVPVVVTP